MPRRKPEPPQPDPFTGSRDCSICNGTGWAHSGRAGYTFAGHCSCDYGRYLRRIAAERRQFQQARKTK